MDFQVRVPCARAHSSPIVTALIMGQVSQAANCIVQDDLKETLLTYFEFLDLQSCEVSKFFKILEFRIFYALQ